jgi:H+/Cl- antiporter ClcA
MHPYYLFVVTPLTFLLGWWLVHRIAPEAQGSGIPQVMAAVETHKMPNQGPFIERLLGIRTVIVKVLSSGLCVMGGGAVGREGPTIQMGASIFHFVGRKSEKVSSHLQHDFWVITGGAAGIAAAFNTPLGGLVYAIEELTTTHFNKFKTSLIAAVIISGLASQWITGSYLYLGFPKLMDARLSIVPWTLLIGLVCGLMGAIFGKLLFKFSNKRRALMKERSFALVALGCGLGVAALTVFFDSRAAGSGKEITTHLLFTDGSGADWKLMIVRFVSPILSYLSGCAGGIFAPSLAAGASIGTFLANIFNIENSNLITLLGMIAFLTGVTHAPFTSFVLVLEMTDRHSAIFPMMLAALSASMIAKIVDRRSFYEHMKEYYIQSNTKSQAVSEKDSASN